MDDPVRATEAAAVSFMTLLRRHRIAKGMTQTKLAKRMGVTPGAVCLWESGGSMPAPEKFPKLARLLGVDPLELTRLIDPEPATAK